MWKKGNREAPMGTGTAGAGDGAKAGEGTGSMPSVSSPVWSGSLLDILGIDLIAEKLLSFLNVSELKLLSEVSWGTLYAVRKLGNFSNLARLHLSEEVLTNGPLKLGEGANFIWKNVSLDLSGPGFDDQFVVASLREPLEMAESLNIYDESTGTTGQRSDLFPRLEQVLKQTQQLKVMGVEVGILCLKPQPEFFTNPEIQRVLRGLHELTILGYRRPHKHDGDNYHINQDKYVEGKIVLHHNMLQLSHPGLQLKKISFMPWFGSPFEKKLKPAKFIVPIINANSDSLEVIELGHRFLKEVYSVEVLEELHCPNLKSLKLREKGHLAFQLEDFLMAQPPLEQLDIFLDGLCDYRFLQGLTANGKFGRLTRLHLDGDRAFFLNQPDIDLPPVDWQLLAWIPHLKDFALTAPSSKSSSWDGVGEDILRCLPPTTEKISIRGITRFWKQKEERKQNIGKLLSRFHNVIELDLSGCSNTVNDMGLQALIRHCPKITSLAISGCHELTDFGLTGRRTRNLRILEKTGISLDQLKGLAHLKVKDCPWLTRKGLLRVVRFQHLRTFLCQDIAWYSSWRLEMLGRWGCMFLFACRRYKPESGFLFRIANQNPSLEKVGLGKYKFDIKYEDTEAVRAELGRVNPRVKDLDLNHDLF